MSKSVPAVVRRERLSGCEADAIQVLLIEDSQRSGDRLDLAGDDLCGGRDAPASPTSVTTVWADATDGAANADTTAANETSAVL